MPRKGLHAHPWVRVYALHSNRFSSTLSAKFTPHQFKLNTWSKNVVSLNCFRFLSSVISWCGWGFGEMATQWFHQLKSRIEQASESGSKPQTLGNGSPFSTCKISREKPGWEVENAILRDSFNLFLEGKKKKSHWQVFVSSKTLLSNTLSCWLENIFNSAEKPFSTPRNPFCSKLINFCFVHKSKILCQTLRRNPFSYLKKYIWCSPGWFLLYGQKFTLSNYILQKAFQLT